MTTKAQPRKGFTLVEIAVVLAVIALLVGGLLAPLATHQRMRHFEETERTLDRVEQALLGFAVSHGRLPCADRDGDGAEDGDAIAGCAPGALEGRLPWATLDSDATDAWGRVLAYRVSEEFTHPVATGMPPAPARLDLRDTRGDITVLSDAAIVLASHAPAVVVSTGANATGGSRPGADEAENLDGDATFVRRAHTPPADGCDDGVDDRPPCEFDDQLRWIPAPVLLYHLVQAGLLP